VQINFSVGPQLLVARLVTASLLIQPLSWEKNQKKGPEGIATVGASFAVDAQLGGYLFLPPPFELAPPETVTCAGPA